MNQDLHEYLHHYRELTPVAYSPLLKEQYNKDVIEKKRISDSNK